MKLQVLVGAFLVAVSTSNAADAVFSADGKTVYAVPWRDLTGVWRIDAATGEGEIIPFPKPMEGVSVFGIAREKSGALLLATSKIIWSWEPGKKVATKRVSMEEESFWDVAVHPATQNLIMDCRDFDMPFLAAPGWGRAGRMFARRAEGASKFAFAADGTAFFAVGGDLWAGNLYWWDKNENEIPKQVEGEKEAYEYAHAFGTEAARMVALGVLQSNSSNQRNVTLDSIATSRERVYVWVGNRDSGELISLPMGPMTAAAKEDASPSVSDAETFLKLSGTLIREARFYSKTLGMSGKHPWLCASDDHRRIFVRGSDEDGEALFLITDDGEPRKIAAFEGDD